MTELDFIVRYWNPDLVKTPKVVYVGAAPGTHLGVLSDLFPSVEFYLYDERPFDELLNGKPGIKELNQKLFLGLDVQRWQGRDDVFFISDIRNLKHIREEIVSEQISRENERMIWEDMTLQQEWVQKIQPVRAHLKFRLPYSWPWLVREQGPTKPYLDGLVYRQPWAPQTSTECRLVPYPDLRMRDWDYEHQEGLLFYHNTKLRMGVKFNNPLTGTNEAPPEDIGLTDDYDSTLTTYIVMGYLIKHGVEPIPEKIYKLLRILINGANGGRTNLISHRAGLTNIVASVSAEVTLPIPSPREEDKSPIILGMDSISDGDMNDDEDDGS